MHIKGLDSSQLLIDIRIHYHRKLVAQFSRTVPLIHINIPITSSKTTQTAM